MDLQHPFFGSEESQQLPGERLLLGLLLGNEELPLDRAFWPGGLVLFGETVADLLDERGQGNLDLRAARLV